MKEYFFQLLKAKHNEKKYRIYISRDKAAYRKVLNEADLIPVLECYGFRIICAEDMSMVEQINLFKDAAVIMGIHGAGLSNMLFAETGTHVVELRSAKGVQNNLFYQLASCLDHSYSCFFSEMADGDDFQRANITVDPVCFSDFLKKLSVHLSTEANI